VQKIPAYAGDGALAVTSEPRDAEVWLERRLRAKKTPVVLQRLAPGVFLSAALSAKESGRTGQDLNIPFVVSSAGDARSTAEDAEVRRALTAGGRSGTGATRR